MANPVKGEVAFQAGGEDYTLCYDFNAICTLEGELGVDMASVGETLGAKASTIRTVFRIGLEARHPGVTDLDAGRIITDVGPAEAANLIAKAFKAAFPEAGKANGRPR